MVWCGVCCQRARYRQKEEEITNNEGSALHCIAAPRYRDHLLFYFVGFFSLHLFSLVWFGYKCRSQNVAHRLGWKLYGFDFDTVSLFIVVLFLCFVCRLVAFLFA